MTRPTLARPHLLALCLAFLSTPALASFVTFESGQVRPLAMSPDGTQLFAVNTPDNTLEIFTIGAGTLTKTGSVPVGLEPVAVAARTDTEVWVVNHLSDSVSIVDLAASPPRVVRTLLVGDEPRDIVIAGPGGERAFITAAHRGQNAPFDPQLTTPGVGRADVWVFDVLNLGPASLGGVPVGIVNVFADTPRALAVTPDRRTILVAAFQSGNQTTTISEGVVCNGGSGAAACNIGGTTYPGGLPAPNTNSVGAVGPETGLILKFNKTNSRWEDRGGRNWTPAVRFNLPDRDVFGIDWFTLATNTVATGVGTTLFNMVTHPVTGRIYVSNTEARNEIRFEGPGIFGGSTVRGRLAESRITMWDGTVNVRHLNKHINYAVVPSPAGVADASLATPMGMAFNANGTTLYVAAFGSGKVGVFNTAQLDANTFTPSAASHIPVTGGGPTGLVFDAPRNQLYVFTRFDNGVSVVNTLTAQQVFHTTVHNPEPAVVKNGRKFLYDALLTSSNGEASCASCHIFGDFDSLAWDLGNPDEAVLPNNNLTRVEQAPSPPFVLAQEDFHPMKGPMTTQSLRGMANHGPMHWRGDRSGANDPGGVPNDSLNEDRAFKRFNPAFVGLVGRATELSAGDMQAFTDFILQVTYPPNPIRSLDNSLTPDQQAGRNFYFGPTSDVFQNCNGCHVLNPAQGFFGSDGFQTFENEPQFFKIAHLRNLYQKVGMFGMPAIPFVNSGNNGHQGDQIRGFGFLHDGSIDTVFRFHNATVFNQVQFGFNINPGGFQNGAAGDPLRRQVEQFMLAFDSNLAPMVGQQVTLTPGNVGGFGPGTAQQRITDMIARAAVNECEVIVKGPLGGLARGWLRLANGSFRPDRAGDPTTTDAILRSHTSSLGLERTYTCVPPGSGFRMGVDRDDDTFLDRDELDAGSDPADPGSVPGGATTTTTTSTSTTTTTTLPGGPTFSLIRSTTLTIRDDTVPPIKPAIRRVSFKSITKLDPIPNQIVPPPPGSAGDPTLSGGTLIVYNAAGLTLDRSNIALGNGGPFPNTGWKMLGTPTNFKGWKYRGTDPVGGITSVLVKPNMIAIKGGKFRSWTYTLDEPQQGAVAVRLTLGTAQGWCASAPAKLPTATNDKVDRFTGAPKTGAPVSCPPEP
jgi:YVTN family beta-propeller protein